MTTRCRRNQKELLQYLDQSLPMPRTLELEAHLDSCESCRLEVTRSQRMEEDLFRLPRPCLTVEDRHRIQESVLGALESPPIVVLPRSSGMLPKTVLAAAALIIILSGIWRWRTAETSSTTPIEVASNSTAELVADIPTEAIPDETEALGLSFAMPDNQLSVRRNRLKDELQQSFQGAEFDPILLLDDIRGITSSQRVVLETLSPFLQQADLQVVRRATNLASTLFRNWGDQHHSLLNRALEKGLTHEEIGRIVMPLVVELPATSANRLLKVAVTNPVLREQALIAWARNQPTETPLDLQPLLQQLAASNDPADGRLLRLTLESFPQLSPNVLLCFTELAETGLREEIGNVLRLHGGEALTTLNQSLVRGQPLTRNEALVLVSCSPHPGLMPTLVDLVRHNEMAEESLHALAEIADAKCLTSLFDLVTDRQLSQQRKELATAAIVQWVTQTATESDLTRGISLLDSSQRDQLISILGPLPSPAVASTLLQLCQSPMLPSDFRSRLVYQYALNRFEGSPEEFLDSFFGGRRNLQLELDSDRQLATSLLVCLHVVDPGAGLQRGLDEMGVELGRREQIRLRHFIDRRERQPQNQAWSGFLAEISEFLRVGP